MNDLPKEELLAVVKQRIESRYRRILFVHHELAKLNVAVKQAGPIKTIPGGSFEDFVFSAIDFSIYKKIDAEEFRLLFDEGLADFEESFYQKTFTMSREDIRRTITEAYIKEDSFYICKRTGLLLLSIMRTVHSSLDFAPVLTSDDVAEISRRTRAGDTCVNGQGFFSGKDQLRAAAKLLDGALIRHKDGMETKLFTPKAKNNENIPADPLLCGTFYPMGKAYDYSIGGPRNRLLNLTRHYLQTIRQRGVPALPAGKLWESLQNSP